MICFWLSKNRGNDLSPADSARLTSDRDWFRAGYCRGIERVGGGLGRPDSVLWGSAEVARLLLDEESDGEIRLADVNAERVMSALTG